MALRVPGPSLFANGTYHLNVRVTSDLAAASCGTRITLRVDVREVVVTTGDEVIFSLRTNNSNEARKHFTPALAALQAHREAVRRSWRSSDDLSRYSRARRRATRLLQRGGSGTIIFPYGKSIR